MEERRRRGGREGDEMENRIRELNRREARGQTRWHSGLSLPLSLPWLLFVLCTPTSLSCCSISQVPVGSALSRQPGKLKRERKGAGQESPKVGDKIPACLRRLETGDMGINGRKRLSE